MQTKKKFDWKNVLFIILIILLIIPQTRTPIQVVINKIKVALLSPSELKAEDQQYLTTFTYKTTTLDGQKGDVVVGNGKVTFISFWATWCPPCIAELPSIAALYKDYGDRIQFLLITNEEPTVVTKFLDKKNLQLPIVNPAMQTPPLLYEETIPTNYIIDKQGRIIVKEKGATDWNSDTIRAIIEGLL